MDHDEQREEEPRQFEKGREVREEQTRNIRKEASETPEEERSRGERESGDD
ncbi:MAG: hypothetical protein M3N00_05840 [Actinomycetota bacterium]|nr:hypothetical protein [Actinomycetota bacterium]